METVGGMGGGIKGEKGEGRRVIAREKGYTHGF